MSRRHRPTVELTVLDGIRLGILPGKDRIAAIAATMLRGGVFVGDSSLRSLVKLMTDDDAATDIMVKDVAVEMERQLRIRSKRISDRKHLRKALAMGSQLGLDKRTHRVCEHLFGEPAKWGFIGPVCPRITKPYYTWFKRMPDGVLVAGVEGLVGSELRAGFVFKITHNGTPRFAKLPTSARNLESLLKFLGLHSRLADSHSIKIDWMRRAFIVDGTNHLPWVYL